MHEVVRVLGERAQAGSQPGRRDDAFRVALAIEGGGMRGTISAGMAFELHTRGLVPAFDAVYGASAGAITAAWLLSRPDCPDQAPPAPPSAAPAFISATSALDASAVVFSIRPPAESPRVSRLATDGRLLRAAFESGRAAVRAAFPPSAPSVVLTHDREHFWVAGAQKCSRS